MSSTDDAWRALVRARAEAMLALLHANRAVNEYRQELKEARGAVPNLLLDDRPQEPVARPWFAPVKDPALPPFRYLMQCAKAGIITDEEFRRAYR